MHARTLAVLTLAACALGTPAAADDVATWPKLTSTFPSTGGNGIVIKGYDPVITGGKCVTTFMAVEAGANPQVYSSLVEFDAVPEQDGLLCTNGSWRSFDGKSAGTTPFRMFYKAGVFYAPRT